MRAVAGPLLTAMRAQTTALAILVDIITVGGRVFTLTSSDRPVTYAGQVYKPGCDPSQVRTVLGTEAESCTVDVLIDPDGISAGLIEAGVLDDAAFRVLICDVTNPTSAISFFEGFVATVSYKDRITAEISGNPLVSRDKLISADVYSSNCRTDFGDSKCKVNLDALKKNCTVQSVQSLQQFTIDDTSALHYWQAGSLVFTSGDNDTFSFEIADSTATGLLTLRGILPFPVSVGDTLTIYPGCDKTPTMCNARWANILNFRGEPFSVAPWIATSEASVSTTTVNTTTVTVATAATRDLYLYTINRWSFGLGLTDNPGPVTYKGKRIPDWGPVRDQWNFAGVSPFGIIAVNSSGSSGSGGSGGGTVGPIFPPEYWIASKLTFGTFGGAHIQWSEEKQLDANQAAVVRLVYPDA